MQLYDLGTHEDVPTSFVVDNGSYLIKSGYCADALPRSYVPPIVGRPRNNLTELNQKDYYVGDTAMSKRGVLNLNYPLHRGLISNFDDMEALWHHIFFNEFKLGVYDSPTIMTEHPLAPSAQREKITQIMFESFSSPAFFMKDTASFVSYTSGTSLGVIVESGHSTTTVAPFYNNEIIKSAIMSLDIGGDDLDNFFIKSMAAKGIDATTTPDQELTRYSKEKDCFVALDPTEEQTEHADIKLSSGAIVQITDVLHTVPEALFQPPLLGLETSGVHELICSAIKKTDPAIQAKLWHKIILSGGSTLFKGFEQRLHKELILLAPPETQIKVVANAERKFLPFSSASLIAAAPLFQEYWITKQEYDEYGPGVTKMRQDTFTINN